MHVTPASRIFPILTAWIMVVLLGAAVAAATTGSPSSRASTVPVAPGRGASDMLDVVIGSAGRNDEGGVAIGPAAGTAAFRVETTTDGQAEVSIETWTLTRSRGTRSDGRVEVRIDGAVAGRVRVVVIDRDASGVRLVSTELRGAVGESTPCVWSPPVREFGALGVGSTWSVDSTCESVIEDVVTRRRVVGDTQVLRATDLTIEGVRFDVVELQRRRSTRLEASVGDEAFEQTVTETGLLYLDQGSGLVVRSVLDVLVEGAESRSSRAITTIVPASRTGELAMPQP